jgi:hypothetical protein
MDLDRSLLPKLDAAKFDRMLTCREGCCCGAPAAEAQAKLKKNVRLMENREQHSFLEAACQTKASLDQGPPA